MIKQAVGRKLKVLVCAPSNVAVDNILERLAAAPTPGQGAGRGKGGAGEASGLAMVRLRSPWLPLVDPPCRALCQHLDTHGMAATSPLTPSHLSYP